MSVTREEVRKYTQKHIEWLNSQKALYGDDPDLVIDIEVHTALLAALDDAERYGALRTRFADSLTRRVDHDTLWSASVTVTGLVGSVEINSFAGDKDALLRMKFDSIVDAARAGGA